MSLPEITVEEKKNSWVSEDEHLSIRQRCHKIIRKIEKAGALRFRTIKMGGRGDKNKTKKKNFMHKLLVFLHISYYNIYNKMHKIFRLCSCVSLFFFACTGGCRFNFELLPRITTAQ